MQSATQSGSPKAVPQFNGTQGLSSVQAQNSTDYQPGSGASSSRANSLAPPDMRSPFGSDICMSSCKMQLDRVAKSVENNTERMTRLEAQYDKSVSYTHLTLPTTPYV